MERFLTETNEIPILGEYDVIVAGGGPAGVGAAYAAGKAGAKTLLVEQMNFLGGMWTGGLVNPLFDYKNKNGLLKGIVEELKAQNYWGGFWDICFAYEPMKSLLDRRMREAGVKVLCGTGVVKPVVSDGNVTGIITENKSGRNAFLGKVVIDCTGDADVACRAGVKCQIGRPEDGAVQGMTLMFMIGNVDYFQHKGTDLFRLVEKAKEEHGVEFTLPHARPYIIRIPNSRTAVVQLTHVRGYNPVDAFDLTEVNRLGREQAAAVVDFMKKYIPELRDIELLQTAPLLGVRESRRIEGEYTLTEEDLTEGRRFPDGIAEVTFNIDIHSPDNSSQKCAAVQPYLIPYRCLIPKGIGGLLVAGRCISGTHVAMSSYRVTGNCIAMGEAAGYAAYEAVKQQKDVRAVAVEEILKHIEV